MHVELWLMEQGVSWSTKQSRCGAWQQPLMHQNCQAESLLVKDDQWASNQLHEESVLGA